MGRGDNIMWPDLSKGLDLGVYGRMALRALAAVLTLVVMGIDRHRRVCVCDYG